MPRTDAPSDDGDAEQSLTITDIFSSCGSCLYNTPGILWAFTWDTFFPSLKDAFIYIITKEHLSVLFALPLGYYAATSNFSSCEEAVEALLQWIQVGLTIQWLDIFGGASAESLNFYAYFWGNRDFSTGTLCEGIAQFCNYFKDRNFSGRGPRGIIEGLLDLLILKPAGLASAVGTAFIGYLALQDEGKPALFKTIASYVSNALQSGAATGNVAVILFRAKAIGEIAPILRALADKMRQLDRATLLLRCNMSEAELRAYFNDLKGELISNFSRDDVDALVSLDRIAVKILSLYQSIHQGNDKGPTNGYLFLRDVLMGIIALNGMFMAYYNRESLTDGLKLAFPDSKTAVHMILPLALIARMSLFGLSSINMLMLRSAETWHNIKNMWRINRPFTVGYLTLLSSLVPVCAFSGFTFAHTIYTQHKNDDEALLAATVLDALILSASINSNRLLGDLNACANMLLIWLEKKLYGDAAKLDVAIIELATALYGYASTLSSRFYYNLERRDANGHVTASVELSVQRLIEAMRAWDQRALNSELVGRDLRTVGGQAFAINEGSEVITIDLDGSDEPDNGSVDNTLSDLRALADEASPLLVGTGRNRFGMYGTPSTLPPPVSVASASDDAYDPPSRCGGCNLL